MSDQIEVLLDHQSEGWVLTTNDTQRDTLAGPEKTEASARKLANTLNFIIISPKVKDRTAKSMLPGWLFRIVGGNWYWMQGLDKKNCLVRAIGKTETTTIPGNTRIMEISVLSLT